MITPATRLRLARKVRLRLDPTSGRAVLLYPERGLELSDSAARIVALCAEERTVATIVDDLCTAHAAEPRDRIESEVIAFLAALEERGLLAIATAAAAPPGDAGAGA
jgi:coenzyme PQQ biosynthesis protein PqqD